MIERGRTGAMDAPGLFAHGDDAAARGFSRGEMNVGQLGEGVADLVVDGALADFAAFDVRDGNAQRERDAGGRQHLVAVGDEEQQIGTPAVRASARPRMAMPMVLAMPVSVSELSRHSMRALMGKPSRSISCDGVAELGREMRAESDDAQLDVGVSGEFAQRPVEMAVIGARSGDDGNAVF